MLTNRHSLRAGEEKGSMGCDLLFVLLHVWWMVIELC